MQASFVKDEWPNGRLADIHSSLTLSKTLFRYSCESLLSPLKLSESTLGEIGSGGSEVWENPLVCQMLQRRLGHNYTSYTASVKHLNELLVGYREDFNPEKDNKVRI